MPTTACVNSIIQKHVACASPRLNNELKIGFINVRSLYPKLDEIQYIIQTNDFDIFGINETWLDQYIKNEEISIQGYNIVRKDRNRHGGGVCVYIKQTITYNVLFSNDQNPIESIWLNLTGVKLCIGCIYRPPSSDNVYYNNILDHIEQVKNQANDIIIIGDLNFNYQFDVSLSTNPVHYIESAYDMTQLVEQPTRVTETSSSLLDIILTTVPERHKYTRVSTVSLSDHYMVQTCISTKWKINKSCHNTVTYREFKNFDYSKFAADLKNDSKMHGLCITACNANSWDVFKDSFNTICNKHAPFITRRMKQRCNPWITPDVIRLMYERDHAKKQLDKNKTLELLLKYRKLRNNVNKVIRSAKKAYYETELSNVSSNPRKTWKLINKLTNNKVKTTPPSELTAEMFNQHFSNIGRITVEGLPQTEKPPWKGPISNYKFELQEITTASVYKRLKQLGTESCNDVLGMDSKLLCLSADITAPALTKLFNYSIRSNYVPKDWKFAKVTPVYKGKGDRLDKSNYRPISVISHVAKLFERELQSQLMSYLLQHDFVSMDQSAYRQHHNTQTSLQRVIDDWLDLICDDTLIGVCFLDIAKCFDTIDHEILAYKLKCYGIVDNEYLFFRSYLAERSQIVACNNTASNVASLSIGVPQGSVLGPVLFLLYINDVSQHIYLGKANIYADDTLIYCTGNTIDELQNLLQSCVNDVSRWYKGNRLVINANKCSTMLITTKGNMQVNNVPNIKIDDNILNQVKSTNYLGVTINENMLWDNHINSLCAKLSYQVSKLARLRAYTPLHVLRKLYFSCVQPTIDYCINIWACTTDYNINKIQRLQNFAGRVLANNFDYIHVRGIDILKQLSIMNVKQRAAYFNLLLMFKCIHGLAPEYLCNQVTMSVDISERNTRSVNYNNVHVPFPRKTIFKSSFVYNGSVLWNNMPNFLKECSTILSFKKFLKEYIFSTF